MAEKKCFCHLNGYEVKDAQARRDIDDLYGITQEINDTIGIWDDETKTLTGEALAHRAELDSHNERMDALDTFVENLEGRIDAQDERMDTIDGLFEGLESDVADLKAAGSGGKLYRHYVSVSYQMTDTGGMQISFTRELYNTSPTPLTDLDQIIPDMNTLPVLGTGMYEGEPITISEIGQDSGEFYFYSTEGVSDRFDHWEKSRNIIDQVTEV